MQQRMDIAADHVLRMASDHSGGSGIDKRRVALEIDSEDSFRRGFENQLGLPAQLAQLLRLLLDRLALSKQLHEDADFRAKHLRMKRLEDVVDRAELVAAKHVRLAAAQRSEKNDR